MARSSSWIWVGLAVALAAYGALAWHFAWLCDDAFISFRYAENWAEGRGLRFNPGESAPVEGYSNFLWVAVGALVERLGGEQTEWMPWVSAGAGGLLLVVLGRALVRGVGLGAWTSSLAVLTLAASVPFATWATGGLETMAFAALFFIAFSKLVLEPEVSVIGAGLAGLALAMIRIEGTFWAGGLALLAWWSRRERKQEEGWSIVGYVVVVAAGAWAWWIARYLYYGDPWPNTVYVKVGLSGESLAVGLRYLGTFVLAWLTPLFMLLALPVALRREHRAIALPAAACALGVWVYAAMVGGDFMAMGRLLVPALAFQTLLLAIWLGDLARRPLLRALVPVLALAHVALGLAGGFERDLVPVPVRERLHFRGNTEQYRSELVQWRYMRDNTDERTTLGLLLAETTAPGESLVRGAIGVIGYTTDLFVYDTFGLVSADVARREDAGEEGGEDRSPGHWKKVEPEYFLDRDPTYVIARSFPVPIDDEGARTLRNKLRRLSKRWREPPIGDRYAPVLTRHSDPRGRGGEHLLVRVRLVEDGDVAGAWERFESGLAGI